ncbi:hypothetical protein U4E84_12715 [Halorubrum sp. AD140]|uniref:hypothetical protein n=1 Tax=Halorubrum sp. AD140 TaxID=3050073 RepID=UPI002ACCD11B|nr:hypothetical protein [Halorubrum sp. AD140]MDZ5812204.1 hypothetical protein [Halorubrum sp. AD140]
MGVLSRLRAWISGASEGDETSDAPAEESPGDEGAADDEPAGLDPNAATETRTVTATDDAVDALRDVRRSHADDASDEGDRPTEED